MDYNIMTLKLPLQKRVAVQHGEVQNKTTPTEDKRNFFMIKVYNVWAILAGDKRDEGEHEWHRNPNSIGLSHWQNMHHTSTDNSKAAVKHGAECASTASCQSAGGTASALLCGSSGYLLMQVSQGKWRGRVETQWEKIRQGGYKRGWMPI